MLNNEVKTLITDTILLYSQDRITQSNINGGMANLKQAIKLLKDNSDDIYIIELNKFNIKNDNTDGYDTTTGINLALLWAKENGYKKVRLPEGEYLIDTSVKTPYTLKDKEGKSWTGRATGICMLTDMELDLTGCVLNELPNSDPYHGLLYIAKCDNVKIKNGKIIGDRLTHDYGYRVNNNGDELESGTIDSVTGELIEDETRVRTKNFISYFEDWFTKKHYDIPEWFNIMTICNTTFNTVDGGKVRVHCYDENEKYLGYCDGLSFGKRTVLKGTKKIKISIWNEKRLDAVLGLNQQPIYWNPEFTCGICIVDSHNITIDGCDIKQFTGDCIQTFAPPVKVTVDDLNIINCTLEESRRQGISFVGTGERYLVKNCNIGKINGTDPQSGIDFEHYDYVKDVVIDGCNFYDNKKIDILNYNGWDIEIKNCKFNGSVTSTFGYNMDIHDNEFIYYNAPWLDKSHKGSCIGLGTNKTEGGFKVYNNYFEGYMSVGGNSITDLPENVFTNNTIVGCHFVTSRNSYNNIYINSKIRYSGLDYVYKDEKFDNCIICGDNNGRNEHYRYFEKCVLNNCEFKGGCSTVLDTIFNNCEIYNNDKTFCSTWAGAYTIKSSKITTEYITNIPFISSQGCKNVNFERCILNVSCTPFVLTNYGLTTIKDCEIIFNESYKSDETINFFNYGRTDGKATFDGNNFYKNFEYPKVRLIESSNSQANGEPFTENIII